MEERRREGRAEEMGTGREGMKSVDRQRKIEAASLFYRGLLVERELDVPKERVKR